MKMVVMLIPLLILGMSCGDRKVKDDNGEAFAPNFSHIRATILMPKCSKCHSLVESRKLLLDKWVVAGDAGGSDLYTAIDNGSMPPYGNKLLDEEIEAIRSWIDSGAPND